MDEEEKLIELGKEAESRNPMIDPQEFDDAMDLAMSMSQSQSEG